MRFVLACNTFLHAGNMLEIYLIISSSWWDSECAELEHAGTGTFRRLNHVHLKEQNWAAWHNPDISYQYQFYHWVLSFFKVGVVVISTVPFPASTCFWVSLVFSKNKNKRFAEEFSRELQKKQKQNILWRKPNNSELLGNGWLKQLGGGFKYSWNVHP